MHVSRHEWLKVMHHNLRSHWQQPDQLAAHIIQALQDGLVAEVEEAAKQLHRIDTTASRGATLLAIVYLQTQRPAQAEKLLRVHLAKHGEDGVVLTNLAKAEADQGLDAESLATLWHALELDPNQDNGLSWYEAIHREKNGQQGSLDALRRIAALPNSWRARLWLARHELAEGNLDAALVFYREVLDQAPRPVPSDLLMQLSGDLGNHGHLMPLLELTSPYFDQEVHGLQVGNNLIKACIDTGQLDQARTLLDQLQSQQRPDWRETLGYWEGELQKTRLTIEEPISNEQLDVTLLSLSGPLWLPEDHPVAAKFPSKSADAPHIVLSGSSFEKPRKSDRIEMGPTDSAGRYSRALPLFFAEHIALRSPARTTTLIPWVLNGHGGFAVFGRAYDDESIVEQARRATEQSTHAADFALYSHLIVHGENYTLRLRLIRCIDGRCLAEITHDFPEAAFHRAAPAVFAELADALGREADVSISDHRPTIDGAELDHYLFRLEQALAASCSTMEEKNAATLSNPAEILDGMLHLCLQNPKHLASRMLLLRTLRKLRKQQPALTTAMRPKIESLLCDYPIPSAQQELEQELRGAFD
jgi:tetratricopeptide (TPR) repeat protein